jgi:hypothetical protein
VDFIFSVGTFNILSDVFVLTVEGLILRMISRDISGLLFKSDNGGSNLGDSYTGSNGEKEKPRFKESVCCYYAFNVEPFMFLIIILKLS